MIGRGRLATRVVLAAAVVAATGWWVAGLEDDDAVEWCRSAAQVLRDDAGHGGAVSAQYATRC